MVNHGKIIQTMFTHGELNQAMLTHNQCLVILKSTWLITPWFINVVVYV